MREILNGLSRRELTYAHDKLQEAGISCEYTDDGRSLIVSHGNSEITAKQVVRAVIHELCMGNEEPEAELGDVLDRVNTLAMGYRGTLRKAALAISILSMSRKVNQAEAADVKKSLEHILDSCTESRYINKRIYAEINEDISPKTADLLPWIAFRLLYLANEDCAMQKPDSKGIKHDLQYELAKDTYRDIITFAEVLDGSDMATVERDRADIGICQTLADAISAGGKWRSSMGLFMMLSPISKRMKKQAIMEVRKHKTDEAGAVLPEAPEVLTGASAEQQTAADHTETSHAETR